MRELAGYRIVDEPLPGRLERMAANPIWPLFAFMFGGALFGWGWSVFNAYALGSPTRRRETLIAAGGMLGIAVLGAAIGWLGYQGYIPKARLQHVLLVIVLWKLGISYWLFSLQSRTFELYQHFGGVVRNAFLVVVAAAFARSALLSAAKGNVLVSVFL